MDFTQLLQTVKMNLDLHEEETDEEEIKRETENTKYTLNLEKPSNTYLAKIIYSEEPIHILNKQARENMNETYENINPIQNICNEHGEITRIKELNISTISIFFPLNCETINLSMMPKQLVAL